MPGTARPTCPGPDLARLLPGPGGPGALALPDGRFIDPAVVAAAHRTLSLSQRPR
ncbi:hypothetical protein [Streptomyces sp. 3211.6]|uniref:hypothetical protein n=1 Tax=Streptomyces sp. 3211.6 TaxID=1938845 RepID=UPI001650DFEA|nr:hypothetical protein [Streptomyces sp. 3211.6]